MPINLELKAKITSPNKVLRTVRSIGNPAEELAQTDTYFRVRKGRLKLRDVGERDGQLIFYERNEEKGERWSKYTILRVSRMKEMKDVLTKAFGVDVVVKKRRQVYIYKRIARIHIDRVAGLGRFIEFEVIHKGDRKGSLQLYRELRKMFHIERRDIVRCSYADLIRKRTPRESF